MKELFEKREDDYRSTDIAVAQRYFKERFIESDAENFERFYSFISSFPDFKFAFIKLVVSNIPGAFESSFEKLEDISVYFQNVFDADKRIYVKLKSVNVGKIGNKLVASQWRVCFLYECDEQWNRFIIADPSKTEFIKKIKNSLKKTKSRFLFPALVNDAFKREVDNCYDKNVQRFIRDLNEKIETATQISELTEPI